MQSNDSQSAPTHHSSYYLDEGDIVVRAQNTLFRFHAFHLQRATAVFNEVIERSGHVTVALSGSDGNPLVLDGVEPSDFENLLWFFYESGTNGPASSTCL